MIKKFIIFVDWKIFILFLLYFLTIIFIYLSFCFFIFYILYILYISLLYLFRKINIVFFSYIILIGNLKKKILNQNKVK